MEKNKKIICFASVIVALIIASISVYVYVNSNSQTSDVSGEVDGNYNNENSYDSETEIETTVKNFILNIKNEDLLEEYVTDNYNYEAFSSEDLISMEFVEINSINYKSDAILGEVAEVFVIVNYTVSESSDENLNTEQTIVLMVVNDNSDWLISEVSASIYSDSLVDIISSYYYYYNNNSEEISNIVTNEYYDIIEGWQNEESEILSIYLTDIVNYEYATDSKIYVMYNVDVEYNYGDSESSELENQTKFIELIKIEDNWYINNISSSPIE